MPDSSEHRALLKVNVSMAATPAITVVKETGATVEVPLARKTAVSGFDVLLEAAVPYADASTVLDRLLQGKRLEVDEGFLKLHAVLNGCKLSGDGQLIVAEVPFSGTFRGTLYVSGIPFYNPQTQHIELQNVGYDLKTQSLVLKGAKWLFGNLVLQQLKKYSAVDVTKFYRTATTQIQALLNKEWTNGVRATGTVTAIAITEILVQPEQLAVLAQCSGSLQINLTQWELRL